ncbi:hypothetical protein [Pseudomaricurvus sp.]|uniref:hypothetical protein n=1 Tax=Pseudomaricurvus sp. TaxID=2004510 RepID=UPI003F6AA872
MFNNHKFCVVDVLGLLIGYEDEYGVLNLYLLDGSENNKAKFSQHSLEDILHSVTIPDAKNERIKISDSALLEFIRRNLSPNKNPTTPYILDAHITGTLDLDSEEVQFHNVSHATLMDHKGTYIFEAKP